MVYASMRLPETNDLSCVPVLRSCICLFTSPLYTYLSNSLHICEYVYITG